MSELIAYRKHNPNTAKRVLNLTEAQKNIKKLWLNGMKHIGYSLHNLALILDIPGMVVIDDPHAKFGQDQRNNPQTEAILYPGQQITLRFPQGRVNHTIVVLPRGEKEALAALKAI